MPRADSTASASSALVPGSSILAISVIKTATLAPSHLPPSERCSRQ
jgi:hypothetical protein